MPVIEINGAVPARPETVLEPEASAGKSGYNRIS
jgi:hypothetical protein